MSSEVPSKEIYEYLEVVGIFVKLELVLNVQCFVQSHTLHFYLVEFAHSISRTYIMRTTSPVPQPDSDLVKFLASCFSPPFPAPLFSPAQTSFSGKRLPEDRWW